MSKTIFMIVLGLAGLMLLSNTLYYFGKKTSNVDLPNTLSIVNLLGNFIMILLMLVTIWMNDKSLRESTEKTISAFKEEVSKQIESYRVTSNDQISAIKTSADTQINEAKRAEKEKNRISLLTLRKEIEFNHSFILPTIQGKEDYLKGTHYIVSLYKTAAYEQGMVTNYITDENLINEILLFYGDIYSANEFIKMSMNTNILPLSDKKGSISYYNQKIIEICERNNDRCIGIISKLHRIEEELKGK